MWENRSVPGKGSDCGIYVLGAAKDFCDDVIGPSRPDGNTALCGSVGEDFANTRWPVVVKAKPEVTQEDLVEHLRDLADAIEEGFFMDATEEGQEKAIGSITEAIEAIPSEDEHAAKTKLSLVTDDCLSQ